MLITLSRRTAICQSVAEVKLTGVAPLGALSHRFNYLVQYILYMTASLAKFIACLTTNHEVVGSIPGTSKILKAD